MPLFKDARGNKILMKTNKYKNLFKKIGHLIKVNENKINHDKR